MILAGDIGGTKTRLALFDTADSKLSKRCEQRYDSKAYSSLSEIIKTFLNANPAKPAAACFGLPGPVINGAAKLTNLSWNVSESDLAREFSIKAVRLVNDLAATAAAIPLLQGEQVDIIHAGHEPRNKDVYAVVAPGTGTGQSFLHMQGQRPVVFASEGGHASFAPETKVQIDLLNYLQQKFGRVSVERLACGLGIANIYAFLRDSQLEQEPAELQSRCAGQDLGAVVTQAALKEEFPIAIRTLDLFLEILGSHVGNIILTYLSTGGVYLGGGIPPRIKEKLRSKRFLEAVWNKGRFSELVRSVPLTLITDDHAALIGAAFLAQNLCV
ncbi:MAG: glucokinase [Oligoflexia bacterium]|nr:glucokinase [Oligoflexia bacterium]